jgi:hypothetical protein
MACLHARLGIPGGIEPSSRNVKFFSAKIQKIDFWNRIFFRQNFFRFLKKGQCAGPDRSMPTKSRCTSGQFAEA